MDLALMFHWARTSALCSTSLQTIRGESQPNNFLFPNREVILWRCLALLVQCKEPRYWLTGISRHLARGNVHARTHPAANESCPSPDPYQMGDSGFHLRDFQCKFMGASLQAFSRLDCILLPQTPLVGGTSLLRVLRSHLRSVQQQGRVHPFQPQMPTVCSVYQSSGQRQNHRRSRERKSDGCLGPGQENTLKIKYSRTISPWNGHIMIHWKTSMWVLWSPILEVCASIS